jgi:bla regulator protein blaR1
MTALEMQTLAQLFTERMLNSAAIGVILAGLVWALLRLLGRQSSRTRFAVWLLALAAVAALPFFAAPELGAAHAPAIAAAKLHRAIVLSGAWAVYLFAAWAAGSALLLARLGVGLWRVRRYCSRCSEVDFAGLEPAVAAVLREFSSQWPVRLCVSSELITPAVIGFFRPAIVFPAWLLPQLSAGEVEIILLHELAHLRRRDQWSNLAQKLAKAVFFFHPAMWWIESRLTLEREMACDDLVLEQSPSVREYASFLISFAEKLQQARGLALAQSLMSRMHQTSARVTRILDARRVKKNALWTPVLSAGVALVVLAFGAAPNIPQLVAFRNRPSASQLAAAEQSGAATQIAAVKRTNAGGPEQLPMAKPSAAQPLAIAAARRGDMARAPVAQGLSRDFAAAAIPASYNPRAAASPVHARDARMRSAMRRSLPASRPLDAVREPPPHYETIVILQDTQAGPHAGWTLCIWRVEAGTLQWKALESAIVAGSI